MPAYLGHSIMGQEIYQEGTKNGLFKIALEEKQMRAFAIGSDFSSFSKISAYASHNRDTQAFFLNFIHYIKEHNLRENSTIMALLYGHVSHYFLDIHCHPLIYYNEVGMKSVFGFSNHMLVEGYLSSYLCQTRLHQDIMRVKADFFSKGNLKDDQVQTLLTEVYRKTYHDVRIINSYLNVQKSFWGLETVIKSGMFTAKNLVNISGFERFLDINDLSREELLNLNRERWTNPVTGEIHYDRFMDLYFKSIEHALYAIGVINNYLYDGAFMSELEKVFPNLSFDTGVDCSLGHVMKFTRKR